MTSSTHLSGCPAQSYCLHSPQWWHMSPRPRLDPWHARWPPESQDQRPLTGRSYSCRRQQWEREMLRDQAMHITDPPSVSAEACPRPLTKHPCSLFSGLLTSTQMPLALWWFYVVTILKSKRHRYWTYTKSKGQKQGLYLLRLRVKIVFNIDKLKEDLQSTKVMNVPVLS